jgi:1,5-anhydro-D-fructose reductase (1,5-anhydro-D-mannitol-forming)
MLRWAMIGTGRVSHHMATAINDADGAQLQGVLSRDAATARRFADEHDVPQTYPSLDALLVDPDIDVVYVASPNGLHREHVLAAADADKHVLCEKPMANDVQACLDMISACRRAGVELGIGFQYRQHEAHRTVKELVSAGGLGEAIFADAAVHVPPLSTPSWYADAGMAGGGVLPMSGVHRIDLLRFVLDAEVEEVVAFVYSRVPGGPYEDTVAALLRFDNGAVATVRFALDAASPGDGVAVHGSRGWAAAVRTTSQWWADDGGELSVSTGGPTATETFARSDLYRAQVEEFNAAVTGGERFSATAIDGLRAAEVTAALFEAGRRGCAVRVQHAVVAEDAQ